MKDERLNQNDFQKETLDFSEMERAEGGADINGCIIYDGKCSGEHSGCGLTNGNCSEEEEPPQD